MATLPKGSSATTRNRPISCGVCGLKLRGAAGPILNHGMPEHCGLPMDWTSAEDAYRFLDGRELETHAAVVEEETAHDRRLARTARQAHAGVRKAKQCGSCRRFLTAADRGACPHCGAVNGRRDGDWGF